MIRSEVDFHNFSISVFGDFCKEKLGILSEVGCNYLTKSIDISRLVCYIHLAFQAEKQTRGEFTPLEVAALKGCTSKFSLGGIMFTEILAVVVSTALIAGLFTVDIMELYRRRRLAKATDLLTTGIVLTAIQRHREKVAEKKLIAALTEPFGVNEPEENESEKD